MKRGRRLSHDSWIYNYQCNQYLSPLTLWARISLRRCVLDTTVCDKVCQWLAAGRWFSPVSSTNKTDCHNITEIVLKVALNTINLNLIFNFSWFWLSCFRLFILVTPKDWIICLSNLLTLSIPDEGYSRNVSYTLNEMPTFLFLKHTFVLYFPSFLQVCKIDQPEFQHDIFNIYKHVIF